MAKGNKKSREKEEKKKLDLNPINQQELEYFKAVLDISNTYAKLKQQYGQYEAALDIMKKNIGKIRSGQYKAINVPVAPDVTTTISDKKEMEEYLQKQIKQIEIGLAGIRGQLENKRDLFVEYGLRLEDFVKRRFGGYRVKHISSDRRTMADEEKLFEAEFDELMKSEKKQEEFKQALDKAKKENEKRTKA